jgi:hypothetical protein
VEAVEVELVLLEQMVSTSTITKWWPWWKWCSNFNYMEHPTTRAGGGGGGSVFSQQVMVQVDQVVAVMDLSTPTGQCWNSKYW